MVLVLKTNLCVHAAAAQSYYVLTVCLSHLATVLSSKYKKVDPTSLTSALPRLRTPLRDRLCTYSHYVHSIQCALIAGLGGSVHTNICYNPYLSCYVL